MRHINNFDLGQDEASVQPMSERIMQVVSAPIFVVCVALMVLFVVASVIVISLIPVYLGNKAVVLIYNQNAVLLSVTYKTDLSNQTYLTIRNINALNQQITRALNLQRANLSIVFYNFSSAVTSSSPGGKKRDTVSIQCEDNSTFSGVLLNFQFSAMPTNERSTNYQWQQFFNEVQNNVRSIYKQFNVTISLTNVGAASTNPTANKTRLDCQVVILGAGAGGSHSAYRLAPIYQNNLCIFERESHVGGRTYDLDYNGTVTEAYSTVPITPMGGIRFYETQPVVKQLVDELNISYYRYNYQTFLMKARGKLFTSYNEMCSVSYTQLNCTDDSNGINAQDQLWNKLLAEYNTNPLNLYHFADLNAFCRYLLGDETTDYLRDSFRFRGDFLNTDVYSYLEFLTQDFNVNGIIYYPYEGMSQIPKRMIYQATVLNNARLYLNEQVIRIDENINTNDDNIFYIETSNYKVYTKQLIAAIPPTGWTDIQGSVADEIKSDKHFQSILPIRTAIIDVYWPQRWWEQTSLSNTNIDRVWTRQNCISFIEILSQHPEKKEQNLTRAVYDDGLCVDTWSTLIERSSDADLIQEIVRGLSSIFTDIQIPLPTKLFSRIWPGAWHFQRSNSNVTNKQIVSWALQPITRFDKNQISLVGEAFNIDRSAWVDGAIKSSLSSLYSQFNFDSSCYQNDAAVNGNYCVVNFV